MNRRRAFLFLMVLVLLFVTTVPAFAQGQTHTVQAGETLFSIARRYGLTVQQLASANRITNPELIYVGQVLVIPGTGAPPSAPPSGGGTRTYIVQAGDTLFSIARRNNTTVDTLVRLNGLSNANVLYVGQVLLLPGGQPQPATPQPTATPAPPVETITHVVQPGETLGQIAVRYGTTYQQIALLSGITNPDLIYPGQVLTIRKASTPPATPTTPAPTTPVATTPAATTPAPATLTPTNIPTNTPVPTKTPTPTSTPVTAPSPTPIVGGTVVPVNAPNRLANPSFEGQAREVIFGDVNVYASWEPFYCDEPYTSSRCPAPRQGTGNPPGLLMGRPEYNPTDIPSRVHGGETAQQWFCFYRSCDAGVFQTVTTTPGATCEAGAYVQSWSANGTGFTSDFQTADQRANSTWFIRIDQAGGTNAFAQNVLISRGFAYSDGIYDKYVLIAYTFQATGPKTTIFFENMRLWPIANNDNYIDDAYVRCSQ